MGRRYGSKAAYEDAKRIRNMTVEEERQRRNKERLDDEAMTTHMFFMAALMSSGTVPVVKADKEAALAVELLTKRFT